MSYNDLLQDLLAALVPVLVLVGLIALGIGLDMWLDTLAAKKAKQHFPHLWPARKVSASVEPSQKN